ncbi:MAG: glycosyltransferase [Planctomycetes bacterium]|nr:glycosyltransferase [Planctomycetota bacterium]
MTTIALLTLVNDRAQFAACQASLRPDAQPFPEWLAVEPNKNGWNAAQGLNHGLDRLAADWVVCVHQDVLFPRGFWARLGAALARLDPDVALAGIVGCERSGRYRGHIVDPNGHCYWPTLPHDVLTLDEVLIAVRTSSGLRFSDDVPGFHCYGADLCLEAGARGLRVVAIDAPLVHLSTGKVDASYERAADWLLAKWGERQGHVLPMPAVLVKDDRRAGWWRRFWLRLRQARDRRTRNLSACPDAACAARALGLATTAKEPS